MNFDRNWTIFALDAEVEAFGTSRIASAHNKLRAEVAALKLQLGVGGQGDVVAASAAGAVEAVRQLNIVVVERDRLRELLREAREELMLWMYHGHGSKTSGFGSAPLCNKIDAALNGEEK